MQIKVLLEDWGQWARCRIGTEYPSVAAGMSQCVTYSQTEYQSLYWSDEMALDVDGSIAALARWPGEGEAMRNLLFTHYVAGSTLRQISEQTGIGRNVLARQLLGAEMWVAGHLQRSAA